MLIRAATRRRKQRGGAAFSNGRVTIAGEGVARYARNGASGAGYLSGVAAFFEGFATMSQPINRRYFIQNTAAAAAMIASSKLLRAQATGAQPAAGPATTQTAERVNLAF